MGYPREKCIKRQELPTSVEYRRQIGDTKMKRLLLSLALVTSLNATAALAGTKGRDALIHREITKLVALYSDGFGYNDEKHRHIAYGPLLDSGRKDAVAFFSVGGVDLSNVHYEYIAIFAKGQGRDLSEDGGPKERPYHLVTTALVGSRWSRTLDWQSARISKGKIVVQGTRWGKEDAGCCPTQPIEVTFTLAELRGGLSPAKFPVLNENERPEKSSAIKDMQPADTEKAP